MSNFLKIVFTEIFQPTVILASRSMNERMLYYKEMDIITIRNNNFCCIFCPWHIQNYLHHVSLFVSVLWCQSSLLLCRLRMRSILKLFCPRQEI